MFDTGSSFRKGSFIPAVLSFETNLIERVEQARIDAGQMVAEARDNAEQLLAEAKRRLPRIAAERRGELTEQAQGGTSALERDQAAALDNLRACIDRNHDRALDAILDHIVPMSTTGSRS